jgi:hypothetical protein
MFLEAELLSDHSSEYRQGDQFAAVLAISRTIKFRRLSTLIRKPAT